MSQFTIISKAQLEEDILEGNLHKMFAISASISAGRNPNISAKQIQHYSDIVKKFLASEPSRRISLEYSAESVVSRYRNVEAYYDRKFLKDTKIINGHVVDLRAYILASLPQVVPKLSEYWFTLGVGQQEALDAYLVSGGNYVKASSKSGIDIAIIEAEALRFREFVIVNAPTIGGQLNHELSDRTLSASVRHEYATAVRKFYRIMNL